MSKSIYEFASDTNNHDLIHPNSLHDAWLESCNVMEATSPTLQKRRPVNVELRLLGSRHDRKIILRYGNVSCYQFFGPGKSTAVTIGGHGDLVVHEILILHDQTYSHECVFSSGSTFSVEFENFGHEVQLLAD
jgi:hypothetical protein